MRLKKKKTLDGTNGQEDTTEKRSSETEGTDIRSYLKSNKRGRKEWRRGNKYH